MTVHRGLLTSGIVAILASGWLAGCSEDPAGLSWSVTFADGVSADRAARVEVRILEGGCSSDAPIVWERGFDGPNMASPEGKLARGRYGLWARAVSEDCRAYAEACEPVELPVRESIVVALEPVMEQTVCLRAEACLRGQCVRQDAGVGVDAKLDAATCMCDGDVNGDGILNIIDFQELRFCMDGRAGASECSRADVDCDGDVDSADMAVMVCLVSGLENCCERGVGACVEAGQCFQAIEDNCDDGTYLGDGTQCPAPDGGVDGGPVRVDAGVCPSDGFPFEGNCWHLGELSQSCDQTCDNAGLTCTDGGWNDDEDCNVCRALSPLVDAPCQSSGTSLAPHFSTSSRLCRSRDTTDDPVAVCDRIGVFLMRLCVCEAPGSPSPAMP